MLMNKKLLKLKIILIAFFSLFILLNTQKVNAANVNTQLEQQQGVLLDVARHKMNKDEIEEFISKLNSRNVQYIDLHLSDNERIAFQSDILNNCNDKSLLSNNDLKDIVNYANNRGIVVIPDIDIPSHCNSILKLLKKNNYLLYQKVKMNDLNILNYNKKDTINFIEQLYEPILNDFNNQKEKYFLIGCDEIPNNINDSQALMRFINEMNNYLNSNNFNTIIWNDCLNNNTINQLNNNINIFYWKNINNSPTYNELQNKGFQTVNAKYATHYYQMSDLNNNQELNNWFNKIIVGKNNLTCLWGENSNNISQLAIDNFAVRLNSKINNQRNIENNKHNSQINKNNSNSTLPNSQIKTSKNSSVLQSSHVQISKHSSALQNSQVQIGNHSSALQNSQVQIDNHSNNVQIGKHSSALRSSRTQIGKHSSYVKVSKNSSALQNSHVQICKHSSALQNSHAQTSIPNYQEIKLACTNYQYNDKIYNDLINFIKWLF